MKTRGGKAALVLVLAAILVAPSLAGAAWVKDVAVGMRFKSFRLTGDKNFYGTITADTVDEQRQWYPTNANLLVTFCDFGGLMFEYDHFGAVMESDGHLYWHTFTLGPVLRYHFKKLRIAPYLVAGVTWNWVRFDENNWWSYGFASVAEYDRYRSEHPDDWRTATGRRRDMQTKDSFGYTYGLGVDVFLTKHLALNLDLRWFKAETRVRYRNWVHDVLEIDRSFDYSLDTVVYAVGLRWYF